MHPRRCKSRLRKQGLKLIQCQSAQFLVLRKLQKRSTKTRIETIISQQFPVHRIPCCKIGLQKQGLKLVCIYLRFAPRVYFCCKIGLQKQGLKRFLPLTSDSQCTGRCKIGLQKQGLKHSHFSVRIFSRCFVAKAVYKNKDWNDVSKSASLDISSSCKCRLRKQGLKPKNYLCLIKSFYASCKSRLRKQGLKHQTF